MLMCEQFRNRCCLGRALPHVLFPALAVSHDSMKRGCTQDSALAGAQARQRETQAQVAELQQELENNAGELASVGVQRMTRDA